MKKRVFRAVALFVCVVLTCSSVFASGGAVEVFDISEESPSKETASVPSVSAAAAVLIDADSGRVLYEHNSNQRMPMASTTKIMTALVAISAYPVDTVVRVSPLAVGVEGSSVYLYAGEELTMEQLLYAMLLESANDAAAAIAIAVGGDIASFADMMNGMAEQIGLADTHFENPHGLDGAEHYTTAKDLAALTAYALQNETFRNIVSTYKHEIPMNGSEGTRLLINHNKLLRTYSGAIGVKTGFTKKSGRCLVSAAEREGVTLVAVTLSAPDDWNDHANMLDYGFSLIERLTVCEKGALSFTVPVINGSAEGVTVSNDGELILTLDRYSNRNIKTVIELDRFYFAPIASGEVLGHAVFILEGKTVGVLELTASESVEEITYKMNFWERILSFFGIG